MNATDLVARARDAGLTVTVESGRLVVRGPRSAGDLAGELLSHKGDVLAVLSRPEWQPPAPTPNEGGMTQAELLHWFAHADLPRRAFGLAPWRTVTNPFLFFGTLRADVERGPAGPHIHRGRVVETIRLLHGLFAHRRADVPTG